jgi:cytochrome c oxidase accessory protein FixG
MSDLATGSESRTSALASRPTNDGHLYATRKKIHVRAVSGYFANWRWVLVWLTQIVFYGLPWMTWNDRQAVLFHIIERKFYVFGWVFWPHDAFFLALLLIISAYSLFFFTAVAGRLWCGYACPQTVYTEIFLWIEQKIEGDRSKRMKLDREPLNGRRLARKAAKFLAWGLIALVTGFTFVAYFSPLSELLAALPALAFGSWEWFWILFYSVFTFLMAGVMREQVCFFMCPYARFQSAMFDSDTLVITYDAQRGEPRSVRRKNEDVKAAGRGDCVDCSICIQVCPTGIDIRNGLQYECIGCAACIDACDQVMDKVGLSRGLIRYTTEHALKNGWGKKEVLAHIRRPRILVYGTLLMVIIGAFIWGLATRTPLRVDVVRDRASFGREVEDGMIENVYQLRVMNMTEKPRQFNFVVEGLTGLRVDSLQGQNVEDGSAAVTVGATETQTVVLTLRASASAGEPGAHEVFLTISPEDRPDLRVKEKTVFFFPR